MVIITTSPITNKTYEGDLILINGIPTIVSMNEIGV